MALTLERINNLINRTDRTKDFRTANIINSLTDPDTNIFIFQHGSTKAAKTIQFPYQSKADFPTICGRTCLFPHTSTPEVFLVPIFWNVGVSHHTLYKQQWTLHHPLAHPSQLTLVDYVNIDQDDGQDLGPLQEFGSFFSNGPSSPSLCNYSTLFLIQFLSSIKSLPWLSLLLLPWIF